MNGNKKIAKKIVAGSMAVMMAAGLAGTYEYHSNIMQVQAAEQKDKDTQELKETAENVLADHTTDSEDTGFSKEESVYVKADASGNVKKTTVSEWLKNPEKGTISDTSELKDIKNVKGDETFETGSNNNVSWKSEGNDIYYQGTTDKELPVDVKVSYKLDGKSISPEDLKGKSGKVEIQFSYDNKSKQTVNVNGEDVEMYTPFTMVSAMMLPSDEYSNVTVENGKLVSDGDKNIVVGVAFPGLADDLNLKNLDLDVDIPETVTITADVKDATIGTSITMASADLMNEFGLDDIDSFDDLQDSIADLEDATNQLVDGSKEAADGSKELADGAGTLNDGAKSLADGVGTLKDGAGTLANGAESLKDGAETLANGAGTLANGAGTLANGAGNLATGVNTLNEKSGTLIDGMNSLATGVGAYTGGVEELYKGSNSLADGAKNVSVGAATLNSKVAEAATGAGNLATGAGNLKTGLETAAEILNKATNTLGGINAQTILNSVTVDTSKISAEVTKPSDSRIAAIAAGTGFSEEDQAKVVAAIKEALGECGTSIDTSNVSKQLSSKDILTAAGTASAYINGVSGSLTAGDLANGAAQVKAGADSLAGALGMGDGTTMTIGSGMASVAAGTKQVSDGATSIQAGATKLHENSEPLMAGLTSLKDGGTQLAGGVSQLADGAKQVSDGANALANGSQSLSAGASSLASGSNTLADGTKSLYDGTNTLYEGSNTLADGTQSFVDGANALADGNQTLADGMKEYKEEAIDKLTDLFNGDISSVTDRIDAMSSLAKEYRSFAGISDGVSGTTKFIIETESIDD